MGSLVSASCECGYESGSLVVGAGKADFRTRMQVPARCRGCSAVVNVSYLDAAPTCRRCGGPATPYDHPSLIGDPADVLGRPGGEEKAEEPPEPVDAVGEDATVAADAAAERIPDSLLPPEWPAVPIPPPPPPEVPDSLVSWRAPSGVVFRLRRIHYLCPRCDQPTLSFQVVALFD